MLADIGRQFGDQLIDVAGGGARRRQRPCRRGRRTGGRCGGSDEVGHESFLVGEMLTAGDQTLDVRRIGVPLHIHKEGGRQQVRRTLGLDGKETGIKNTETDPALKIAMRNSEEQWWKNRYMEGVDHIYLQYRYNTP